MCFERIPGEYRLLVTSRTNPDQCYIVDLDYREERWHRPKVKCGCVKGLQDLPCCHVKTIRELVKL